MFCVVLLCVVTFWVTWCDVRYDFRVKTMFGSSLQLCVGGFMFYLRLLCLFGYSVVQHILCCVVLLFCFSSYCVLYVASISGFPILIAHSVYPDVSLLYNTYERRYIIINQSNSQSLAWHFIEKQDILRSFHTIRRYLNFSYNWINEWRFK
jgi:hypothetical protein